MRPRFGNAASAISDAVCTSSSGGASRRSRKSGSLKNCASPSPLQEGQVAVPEIAVAPAERERVERDDDRAVAGGRGPVDEAAGELAVAPTSRAGTTAARPRARRRRPRAGSTRRSRGSSARRSPSRRVRPRARPRDGRSRARRPGRAGTARSSAGRAPRSRAPARWPAKHPRPQAPPLERLPVRADRRLGAGAARDVVERALRERLARLLLPLLGRERPLRAAREVDRVLDLASGLQHVQTLADDRPRTQARCDRAPRRGARVHGGARLSERGRARARGRVGRRADRGAAGEGEGAGIWAPHLPPEAGGTGSGFMEYALLNEEIGRSMWAQLVFNCQAPDAGNGEILHLFGTEEQKERFLKPLVEGTARSFFSMTEPEVSGADPTGLRTTAVLDGDEWVINGHKWFSSVRRGRRVRDRDGGHRPGRAAAPADEPDPRPGRHARLRADPADPGHGTRGPRLVDALRGALHRRPRSPRQRARRARRRLPDRAEAARAGPDPPRHALARPDAAGLRADVPLRARARGLRRHAGARSRRSRTGSPTPRPRSRPAAS